MSALAELNIAKLGEAMWRAQAVRLEGEVLALRAELDRLKPKPTPATPAA